MKLPVLTATEDYSLVRAEESLFFFFFSRKTKPPIVALLKFVWACMCYGVCGGLKGNLEKPVLSPAMCILGIKLGASGLAASAFNGSIEPSPWLLGSPLGPGRTEMVSSSS